MLKMSCLLRFCNCDLVFQMRLTRMIFPVCVCLCVCVRVCVCVSARVCAFPLFLFLSLCLIFYLFSIFHFSLPLSISLLFLISFYFFLSLYLVPILSLFYSLIFSFLQVLVSLISNDLAYYRFNLARGLQRDILISDEFQNPEEPKNNYLKIIILIIKFKINQLGWYWQNLEIL